MKSVEIVMGKDANTRVGELSFDGKARITASSNTLVRKGWRIIAIGGKKVRAADVKMALSMAQSRGKPYAVRFGLPTNKEMPVADAGCSQAVLASASEIEEQNALCVEEIDEQEWEVDKDGDEGDELFWANVFWDDRVAAAEAAATAKQRDADAKHLAAQKAAVANSTHLGVKGGGKKKVINPFGV